jgi:hypothetical protein
MFLTSLIPKIVSEVQKITPATKNKYMANTLTNWPNQRC